MISLGSFHNMPCPTNCWIDHPRIALEAKCIRHMLRAIKKEGWRPYAVDTAPDNEWTTVTTEQEVIKEVFSVDTCTLWVTRDNSSHRILIVLGNGIDCIVDYTVKPNDSDQFDELMTRVYDHISTYE